MLRRTGGQKTWSSINHSILSGKTGSENPRGILFNFFHRTWCGTGRISGGTCPPWTPLLSPTTRLRPWTAGSKCLTLSPTALGQIGPRKKDDICRKTPILMTSARSVQTYVGTPVEGHCSINFPPPNEKVIVYTQSSSINSPPLELR